ncbi:MAG TPA: hypothetical protein VFF40_13065 [Acidimicrobiia bacterium]|nr:hypothetical protein [Acidimicrobiia bacterium]
MATPEAWLTLYESFLDGTPPDETTLRRLAYAACDGDSLTLMTTMLRTIGDLSEQLAQFYGNSSRDVMRMEVFLPIAR